MVHLGKLSALAVTRNILKCEVGASAIFRRHMASRSSFRDEDSTVDSDELLTDNNPWSPTIYEDRVTVRRPGLFSKEKLPKKYRLAYQPLYESPSAKYVSMLKRMTLSFSVLGAYGAKLFYDSPSFDDIYAIATVVSCVTPAVLVQIKTRDYVSRIFRLYDKEKPQTLQNLISDENLIMEKISVGGGKTYNELLRITDNDSLKLSPKPKYPALEAYATWMDNSEGVKRYFYVANNIGGLKMDRIWGIVEHNSGIDNGRYIDDQANITKS